MTKVFAKNKEKIKPKYSINQQIIFEEIQKDTVIIQTITTGHILLYNRDFDIRFQ